MKDLKRLINAIIHDLRLFNQAEIDAYKARMSGATEDQLYALMKEAKALEGERWKEYNANKFQLQVA